MFPRHCEERSDEAIQLSRCGEGKLDCFAEPVIGPRLARTRWLAMTAMRRAYLSLRTELPQCFSDDHTLRDSRNLSTGVEQPSASKRCSSTPFHWKPHFSKMLREAGLVTRAPANRCSPQNSSKK